MFATPRSVAPAPPPPWAALGPLRDPREAVSGPPEPARADSRSAGNTSSRVKVLEYFLPVELQSRRTRNTTVIFFDSVATPQRYFVKYTEPPRRAPRY